MVLTARLHQYHFCPHHLDEGERRQHIRPISVQRGETLRLLERPDRSYRVLLEVRLKQLGKGFDSLCSFSAIYHSYCCSVGKSASILVDTSAWSSHQTRVVREIFQNVIPSEAVDAGGAMARARWVQVYLHIPVITDYTSFTTTTATTVTTVPCLASCCGMVVQISLSEA